MIKAKNSIKGKISPYEKIQGKTNFSVIRPELEELTITPSEENQTFISEKDGYSLVTVNGDSDLKPENIKEGVSIFGIEGKLADTSDADATENDISKGKTAYVNNEKIVGTFVEEYNIAAEFEEGKSNFTLASAINKIEPLSINTENATSFASAFYEFSGLEEIPYFNTDKVTNFSYCFYNCSSLKQIPNFNLSNGLNFAHMCDGCSSLAGEYTINHRNSDIDYSYMFKDCNNIEEVNFYPSMSDNSSSAYMFTNCTNLKKGIVVTTGNVGTGWGNRGYMYQNCSSLLSATIVCRYYSSGWKTYMGGNNLSYIFQNCTNLIDVTMPDPSHVLSGQTQYMFAGCSSLRNITMCTTYGNYGQYMFSGCTSLETVEKWTIKSSVTYSYVFNNCTSLKNVDIVFQDSAGLNYWFNGCTSLTQIPQSIIDATT
ncbi:MAG: leucine-rich repeat protein, partial [Clostridia bacterium]